MYNKTCHLECSKLKIMAINSNSKKCMQAAYEKLIINDLGPYIVYRETLIIGTLLSYRFPHLVELLLVRYSNVCQRLIFDCGNCM